MIAPALFCPYCREPFRPDHQQYLCLTCDAWLHVDCLGRHAAVVPAGEDYRHALGWREQIRAQAHLIVLVLVSIGINLLRNGPAGTFWYRLGEWSADALILGTVVLGVYIVTRPPVYRVR